MARKQEEWVSGNQAARILTKNTDHEVSPAYVRLLALKGKIRVRPLNERENEYWRADVEAYRVRRNDRERVRPRPSVRKSEEREEAIA